jgi:hypothetical protein
LHAGGYRPEELYKLGNKLAGERAIKFCLAVETDPSN